MPSRIDLRTAEGHSECDRVHGMLGAIATICYAGYVDQLNTETRDRRKWKVTLEADAENLLHGL